MYQPLSNLFAVESVAARASSDPLFTYFVNIRNLSIFNMYRFNFNGFSLAIIIRNNQNSIVISGQTLRY